MGYIGSPFFKGYKHMNMKKILFIISILILMALINAPSLRAQNQINPSAQLLDNEVIVDNRQEILRDYFEKFNSPLADFSDEFINSADAFGLDWRLLPAITGVESTYGKFIPKNSYNAYGWNNGLYHFKSWPDSIWYVSKALKENYVDRGAKTIDKIARIYAPPSPTWAAKVKSIMKKIDGESQFTLDL